MTRPGTRLRSIAGRWLSSATMERLIDPAIADLQHEHDEADRSGRVWRRSFVRVVGYAAVSKMIVIAAARQITERTVEEDRAAGRALGFSLVAVMAVTMLLLWPQLNTVRHSASVTTALYLLPQAMTIALPLGIVFGIMLGLRDRVSTVRVAWTLMAFGLGCSVATFVLVGWLTPVANQAFRELASGRRLLRGFNELTLTELASGDPLRVMRLISGGVTARRMAWEFQFRLALAFAPIALSVFSLAAAGARRRVYGLVVVGTISFTTSVGYYLLLYFVRQLELYRDWPPPATAWMPNLAVLAIALLLFRLRHPAKEEFQ